MPNPREHMYTVGKTPDADFHTVQEAVLAVPDNGEAWTIHILPGLYHERVVIGRENITLLGDDPQNTVITWSACAKDKDESGQEKGTFRSFTVLAGADRITLSHLCIRNDAGDGRTVGQAVALYAAGDRTIVRNCHLIACQDTLFCGPLMERVHKEVYPVTLHAETVPSVGDSPVTSSRAYFENCLIQGDVDFIFGPYRCWFEHCRLHMNERGGWYTAANTPQDQTYGMVFHACHLTGDCQDGMAYLGRPWRASAQTTFLDCEMDACVSASGFVDWDEFRIVTPRLQEWKTRGARANMTARHHSEKILTADEAAQITPCNVLNNWQPDHTEDDWFLGHTAPLRSALHGIPYLFLEGYLRRYTDYKTYWNYEDGCILKGCQDLYLATGENLCRDYVLSYLARRVMPDGTIPTFPMDKYNIDSINCGKVLFFALDQTGDERYEKAIRFHHERLQTHPRCSTGNFWHKEVYPEQIWLDGLYMAQPFRAAFDVRFGHLMETADIASQFQNVRKYLFNAEKHLYYHACDLARKQPWANKETGTSANFWLRSMGWYLMALVDCLDELSEQLYEHYRILLDLFREAIRGILPYADPQTHLYYQVIDRSDVAENYLETSGSSMIAYALLKGVRLGFLDEEVYGQTARMTFESLTQQKLYQDAEGVWHLKDICAVAGLGPGEKRDGSVAYYLSEPIVDDDAKGVGPYLMALAEYLRRA